jgi:hypothetical protein
MLVLDHRKRLRFVDLRGRILGGRLRLDLAVGRVLATLFREPETAPATTKIQQQQQQYNNQIADLA